MRHRNCHPRTVTVLVVALQFSHAPSVALLLLYAHHPPDGWAALTGQVHGLTYNRGMQKNVPAPGVQDPHMMSVVQAVAAESCKNLARQRRSAQLNRALHRQWKKKAPAVVCINFRHSGLLPSNVSRSPLGRHYFRRCAMYNDRSISSSSLNIS